MLRRIQAILCCVLVTISAMAQEIPVSLEYVQLYDFLDELATQQLIDIKPNGIELTIKGKATGIEE